MKIRHTIVGLMLVAGATQAADLIAMNNAVQDARSNQKFHNAVTCMNVANLTQRAPINYIRIAKTSIRDIAKQRGIIDKKEQAFVFKLAASNSWAYTSGQIKALSVNKMAEVNRANDIFMRQCILIKES